MKNYFQRKYKFKNEILFRKKIKNVKFEKLFPKKIKM